MAVKTPRKPRTEKQLARDEELRTIARAHNLASRTANAEARMDAEPPVPIDEADLLAQLGAALSTAGTSRAEQNRRLAQVEEMLTTIKPEDYPGLVANPIIQRFIDMIGEKRTQASTQDPPGTVVNVGGIVGQQKKGWQWKDVQDRIDSGEFSLVTFEPNRNEVLIWQGLKINVYADQQCTIPNVFKEVWDESRRGTITAAQHAEWLFRKRDGFDARADPTVIGGATGRSQYVRAAGQGNQGYKPGIGGFSMEEGEAAEENA
jgi:hypothetical protein